MFNGVCFAVVHYEIRTGLPGDFGLYFTAHAGSYSRTLPVRQLHRAPPDRAGSAGNEHVFAGNRAITKYTIGRGNRGHAKGCPEFEGHLIGQCDSAILVDHCPLRSRTPPALMGSKLHPNPLADPGHIHTRSDSVDRPGTIHVGNLKASNLTWGPTTSNLHIGWVDPGECEPHPDLTDPNFGSLN